MNENSEMTNPPKFVPIPGGADPAALKLVQELPHSRGILGCRYEPSGRFLYAGARDYFVHRWDLAIPAVEPEPDPKKPKAVGTPLSPPESRRALVGHESWVRAIDCSADGQHLATGDYVGRLIVWQALAENPTPIFSVAAHDGSIRAVSISPNGKLVATAGNDHQVRVWSIPEGTEVLELSGHDCHVYNTAFHPGGEALVSADLKGHIKHWEIPSGKIVRELDASALHTYSEKYTVDVGGVRGMRFDSSGTRLACAGAVGDKGIAHSGFPRVLLFDWNSGKLQITLKPEKDEIATAWGVAFHPDGFIVGSGGSRTGGYLWFWTAEHEVAFHVFKYLQRAPGFDLDLNPNGSRIAVANHDGTVRLYELTGKEPT